MRVTIDEKQAKSVHVFVWPFKICSDETKDMRTEVEGFRDEIVKRGWKQVSIKSVDKEESIDRDLMRNNYMIYQYLNESARDVFFKEEQATCTIFRYPQDSQLQYYIKKDQQEYYLDITEIELHVYRHGVGIMFIRAINETYLELDQIRAINDYGRRFGLPFMPEKEDGYILCADALGIINVSKGTRTVTDFRERIRVFYETIERGLVPDLETLDDTFLQDVLNCKLDQTKNCSDIRVKADSDDRMFVISLIRDDELSRQIKNKKVTKQELYSLIFIDSSIENLTCQNDEMLENLISEACYGRWENYGTLYGSTYYSLLCLTSASDRINDSVVTPFLVEYLYLVSLVMAQRLGIELFSEQAGRRAEGADKKKKMSKRQIKACILLQEQYITFKNQILLSEASSQEQGIELYRLMLKQFMIQEEKGVLDEQLQNLYEIVNVSQDTSFQSIGLTIAIIPLFIDAVVSLVVKSGVWDWICSLF